MVNENVRGFGMDYAVNLEWYWFNRYFDWSLNEFVAFYRSLKKLFI